MSQQNLFERCVASLHRAALDDAHWLSAASVVNETVGTRGHGLVLGKGTSPTEREMVFWRLCFGGQRREDWERTNVRDYWYRDECLPPVLRLPDGIRRSALETTLFVHVQPVRAESRGRYTHRGAALVLVVRPASPVWSKPNMVSRGANE